MSRMYHLLWKLKTASPAARRMLSRAALLVPDRQVERDVPLVGKLAFGLRRQRWLLHPNCFEGHRPSLGLYERMVRPGDLVYDIGGNIGCYARLALAVFEARQVIAFEPMTDNLKLLRRNAELAGDGELHVVAVALADENNDAATLQIDDVGDGSAVLDQVAPGHAAEARAAKGLRPKTETVRLARLDGLIDELPGPPDVMKIDTEGAEPLVLAGARQVLADHGPRIILATHGPAAARGAFEELAAAGYHIGAWLDTGWSASVTPDDADRLGDNNCIASRDATDVAEEPTPFDLSAKAATR